MVRPAPMVRPADVTAAELKRRLDSPAPPRVLDVREPWEVAMAQISGSLNIPLNEIPQRLHELDREADIVVLCKVGGRSRRAADFLATHGYTRVANLSGGIDAWSDEVDPTMARY